MSKQLETKGDYLDELRCSIDRWTVGGMNCKTRPLCILPYSSYLRASDNLVLLPILWSWSIPNITAAIQYSWITTIGNFMRWRELAILVSGIVYRLPISGESETKHILQIAGTDCRIPHIRQLQYNGGGPKLYTWLRRRSSRMTEEILRSSFLLVRQMAPTNYDFHSGKGPIISENKNKNSHYLHLTYFGSR